MIPASETEGHVVMLPSHLIAGAVYASAPQEFRVESARTSMWFSNGTYLQGRFTDTDEYFGVTVLSDTELKVIS